MDVSGQKVRIRDRIPEDSTLEEKWRTDLEVSLLDPAAGRIFNAQLLTIETLDGKCIGSCSLYNWEGIQVQLGIKIGDKDYWNKGYGTDTVRLLVGHCFTETPVRRIWLKVLPWNARAQRCYEKCGFTRCGRLLIDGYDFVVMEIGR